MQEIAERTEREIHIKDYWMVVQKRLWMVVTFFIITVSLVYLQVSKQEPLYKAAARIQIDRESPRVLNIQEVVAPNQGYWGDEYYETQYKLLRSRDLAQEVVNQLDLQSHPEFLPGPAKKPVFNPVGWLKSSISWAKEVIVERGNGGKKKKALSAEKDLILDESATRTRMVNAFLGKMTISPVKDTRLVDVMAVSRYPKLAAEMSNTLAATFIERNEKTRLSTTKEATGWLSEEMEDARKKLEASELALQRYKEQNDILSLENRQNVVVQKMEELNRVLTEAKTNRIAFETRYSQMEKVTSSQEGMVDTLPEVIENTFIQQLKSEYGQLQNELSDLSKTYTPKHPKIIRLNSQIESLRKQMQSEIEKIVTSIKNEYDVAVAKEKSLQKAVDQQKREVQSLNQKSIRYGALEREVENNRRIYNMLLNRTKETGLAEGLQTGNIRIIDRAEIPLAPFSPNRFRSMMLAVIVGLMGGLGLTFFFDYLDDSIKDPDDLEQHVNLPLLSSIPVIKTRKKGPKEMVAEYDVKSLSAEAYRSARTSIIFSSPDQQLVTILVTSPGPQDGKTLTAVNLAIAMAQTGNRVLLMDADLRKPRVHKVFGLDNKFGLTNLLTESTDIKAGLHKVPTENLAVMLSGPIPPNPSELFVSQRMKLLLNTLKDKFDRIIIDSPPTISVTDSNILASMTDGVVLVVKAGRTSRRIVNRAKKNLEEVRGKILGVILNAVDMRRSRYYYVPSYYYKYYGEEKRKTRKTTS